MNTSTVFRDAWERHLDCCEQCEEHPFALCKEGALLLRLAGAEAQRILREQEQGA